MHTTAIIRTWIILSKTLEELSIEHFRQATMPQTNLASSPHAGMVPAFEIVRNVACLKFINDFNRLLAAPPTPLTALARIALKHAEPT